MRERQQGRKNWAGKKGTQKLLTRSGEELRPGKLFSQGVGGREKNPSGKQSTMKKAAQELFITPNLLFKLGTRPPSRHNNSLWSTFVPSRTLQSGARAPHMGKARKREKEAAARILPLFPSVEKSLKR